MNILHHPFSSMIAEHSEDFMYTVVVTRSLKFHNYWSKFIDFPFKAAQGRVSSVIDAAAARGRGGGGFGGEVREGRGRGGGGGGGRTIRTMQQFSTCPSLYQFLFFRTLGEKNKSYKFITFQDAVTENSEVWLPWFAPPNIQSSM